MGSLELMGPTLIFEPLLGDRLKIIASLMFDPGHFGRTSLDHDGLYCRRSHRDRGDYSTAWRGKAARLGPTWTSCAELRALHHQGIRCLREWSRLQVRRWPGKGAEPAEGRRRSGHGRGDVACCCSRSWRHSDEEYVTTIFD